MDEKSVHNGKDSSTKFEIKSRIGETSDGDVDKSSISAPSKEDNSSSTTADRYSKRTSAGTQDQEKVPKKRRRTLTESVAEVESNCSKVSESESTSVSDAMDADDVGERKKAVVEVTERRLKRASAVATIPEVLHKRLRKISTSFAGDELIIDGGTEAENSDGTSSDRRFRIPPSNSEEGRLTNMFGGNPQCIRGGTESDIVVGTESDSVVGTESDSVVGTENDSLVETPIDGRDETPLDNRGEIPNESEEETSNEGGEETSNEGGEENSNEGGEEPPNEGEEETPHESEDETPHESEDETPNESAGDNGSEGTDDDENVERARVSTEWCDKLREFISQTNEERKDEPAKKNQKMPRQCAAEITNEFKTQAKIVVKRFDEILVNLETDLKAIAADICKVCEAIRELYKLVSNPCFKIKENKPVYENRRLMLNIAISTMKEPNIKILDDLSLSLENAIPSLCCLLSELEVSRYHSTKSGQKEDMCVYLKGYNKDKIDCQGFPPDKKEKVIIKPFKNGVLWLRTGVKERFYSFFKPGFGGNESTEVDNQMDISESESRPNVASRELLSEEDRDVEPVTVECSAAEYISDKLFSFKTKWHDISSSLHQQFSKLQKDARDKSMLLFDDGDVVRSTYELVGVTSGTIFIIEELLKSIEEHCRFCADVIKRFQILKLVNTPSTSAIQK